jgi:hypothetical protein
MLKMPQLQATRVDAMWWLVLPKTEHGMPHALTPQPEQESKKISKYSMLRVGRVQKDQFSH